MSDTPTKHKVGIALSGGGTRGMVHVGVLQALHDHGIYPDVIAGTSAGSIVGSLYARGYSPEDIVDFAKQKKLWRMFGLQIPSKGFAKHTFLRKQLTTYLQENSFEKMAKPFYVIVANLNTGQVETWNDGPLIDLVVASSSIPIMFEPVEIKGNLYVDGGLMMNLPAEPLRGSCDLVIGVNLVPRVPVDQDDLKGVIGVGTRCFDLSALNNIKPQLSLCDIVIEPEAIKKFSRFNFSQIMEMYEIGYAETERRMDEIMTMAGVEGSV